MVAFDQEVDLGFEFLDLPFDEAAVFGDELPEFGYEGVFEPVFFLLEGGEQSFSVSAEFGQLQRGLLPWHVESWSSGMGMFCDDDGIDFV